MPPVISIRDLGIAFGDGDARTEVLKSLDLDIAPGEFLAIVGASGVGKSTLLRILMGLARPSHGSVTIAQAPGAGRTMAMVFQDSRLLPPQYQAAHGADQPRLIAHYIAGMTDRYAIEVHQKLFSLDLALDL